MRDYNNIVTIVIFDPSILTDNLGDYIIIESINREIESIANEVMYSNDVSVFVHNIPTHSRLTAEAKRLLSRKRVIKIIGGSDLFRLHYLPLAKYNQWKISAVDLKLFNNCTILFGVGTTIVEEQSSSLIKYLSKFYSKIMWKKILASDVLHSVRDRETLLYLNDLGFENVVNTGCPTLWDLTPQHVRSIPKYKSESVIFTLTGHSDVSLKESINVLGVLINNYEKIYFWPQSENDYLVFKNLLSKLPTFILGRINILPPNIVAYDRFLKSHSVDYIGFRIHAGIRALQFKKRAIIIAVDSRALSFKRDFNLPVIVADEINNLDSIINENLNIKVTLDYKGIEKFKRALRNHIIKLGSE